MEAVILPLGSESSPKTKNLNLKSMVILAHTLEVSKTGYKNFIYVSPPPPRSKYPSFSSKPQGSLRPPRPYKPLEQNILACLLIRLEITLCVRHCAKHFICITSFNPNLTRLLLFLQS